MKKSVLAVGLLVVIGVGVFAVKEVGKQPTVAVVGTPTASASRIATTSNGTQNQNLTDLSFKTVNGRTIQVNPNEKTVLHFMTSSCASCLPTEQMLTKFAHMPGVQLISVDINPQNDSKSTIQQFQQVAKSNWSYVMETNQKLINEFHVTELDTIVVLQHNRVIFDGVAPSAAQLQKVLV